MSNSLEEVLFVIRALAEVLGERLEDTLTEILSEIGKFDAETRQRLQEFVEEVKIRAQRAKQATYNPKTTITVEANKSVDLQELLDELRAEIARLKAELNNYRQRQGQKKS
ncbi:MAG: hypothetical protein NZ901_04565 [Geminocystis sp.]|nr:hypothetical protein [Geminocystis sp.]HIK37235.1 hypothetical protein [Geminocystis sp. M7585_C2015_104]MCS7147447.1 hypothetical protein [Geminocystis sp.]MCX8079596.1 hypothetical protein [Geminocystis sp.]MDW8115140.1 hypothetical protein [Geminocystis sp.]